MLVSDPAAGLQLPPGRYMYRTVNEKMQLFLRSASSVMLSYFGLGVNRVDPWRNRVPFCIL